MLISDVITLAKNSELRQLAVKNDNDSILGFINLGMLELYKRFPLNQDEAILTMSEGKSTYMLDGSDSDVSMGSAGNFMVVNDCYDEFGEQLNINDEKDALGISTPTYNSIQIANISPGERLSIIYRLSPLFITDVTSELMLPPQLLEALLHYVGYRGHATITADVKEQNNTHYIRFDQSCSRLIEQGLVLPDDLQSYTFDDRGFV